MSLYVGEAAAEDTTPPPPCVVCGAPGPMPVWGYATCAAHQARWRTEVQPPAEHLRAHEVTHEELCAAWKAATREFLGQLWRETKRQGVAP